ncbi:MAG TPA: hypothetical protein ENN55_00135 [Firmicutes bacterium]|nr:hypothetical protein [Bacillota bacterium]
MGDVRLGRAQGPGTEAVYFDDNSLIMDPEPTATPVYEFSNPQKRAWDLVVDTKNLIVRINTDRTRYEKTLRSKMDKQLFRLQQSIASMHTRALLYDRNKVEYVWEKEAVTALDVMDVAHMQTAEFHRDYREAERKHKEAERLLKNHRDIIQKPEEIEQKLEMNAKELYFAKKEVDRFTTLYNRFVEQFNHISKQKEEHIAKTLKEHFDLHRP